MYKMLRKKQDFSEWLCRQQGILPQTALRYVLESLVSFSDANLALTFKPSRFFDKIEMTDTRAYSRSALRQAYYAARQNGLIVMGDDGAPTLSSRAQQQIRTYEPKQLWGAQVMVVFDIPEDMSRKRQWFRLLLRELKFEQVQKSVWTSDYECFEVLSAGILEQQIEQYVRVYEARAIEAS